MSSADDIVTLDRIGVSRGESSRNQKIARLDGDSFERLIARCLSYAEIVAVAVSTGTANTVPEKIEPQVPPQAPRLISFTDNVNTICTMESAPMRSAAPDGRSARARPKRTQHPIPKPDALAVSDGTIAVGHVIEHDGSIYAFDITHALIGKFKTRTESQDEPRTVPTCVASLGKRRARAFAQGSQSFERSRNRKARICLTLDWGTR